MTSVKASELSREAVWQSLYDRRTVATTGPRILVEFRVNGAPMGSELRLVQQRHLEVQVHAVAPVASVEVVKNNEVLFSFTDPELDVEFSLDDEKTLDNDYYYVRVIQQDGHLALCSPVWVGP
jgi:hypothetical protein